MHCILSFSCCLLVCWCQSADKDKIVNYLLSISLYSFCIFLFIIMVLCLFQCFRFILEGNGRNELKQVKKRRNWHLFMKETKFWQTGRLGWSTVSDRGSAQRCCSLALRRQLSGNQILFLFFSFAEIRKLGKFVFRPLWLFKDVQNSSSKHPKTL